MITDLGQTELDHETSTIPLPHQKGQISPQGLEGGFLQGDGIEKAHQDCVVNMINVQTP
jgi:hypothetical protein